MNRRLLLKAKAEPCRNFQVYSDLRMTRVVVRTHTHMYTSIKCTHTCTRLTCTHLTCTQACTHMKGALWTLVLTAAARDSPSSTEMPL